MKREKLAAAFFSAGIMLGMAAAAGAVDGTIEINQAKVLAAGGYPYVISNPGSYRLTGNLTVATESVDAIDVNANNVTIDLNGFSITGPTPGAGSGIGIHGESANGITVENGTATGFGGVGVKIASNSIVRNVHADSNNNGIFVGAYSVVEGCTTNNAGSTGIQGLGEGDLMSGNTVNHGNIGINLVANSGLIVGNTVTNNTGVGIDAHGTSVGYRENIFYNNAPNVIGGTSLGNNICSGVVC